MDLLLLALSILGLAASAVCIAVGAYLLRHPDKRPRIALKLPSLPSSSGNDEGTADFLDVIEKAEQGLSEEKLE